MMPVIGGTLVCCRDITARTIVDAIADKRVHILAARPSCSTCW
jgi:fatty-acyl-CoA synthase